MDKLAKPEGEKIGWHLLDTSCPFSTPWLKLRQDKLYLDGRGEVTFTYVEHPGAVGVVPVTKSGDLVLIRQYRYTVDEWCLEVPAGGTHDTGSASLEDVAREEMREEIGATCEELIYAGFFYTSIGNSSQAFHIYLALGVTLDEEVVHEATEVIETCLVSASEALRLARSGQVKDGASALSILLCEPLLREYGYAV